MAHDLLSNHPAHRQAQQVDALVAQASDNASRLLARLLQGRGNRAAATAHARQAGYTQLELEVVADNERAVSLYRRAGFEEYGRNPRGYRSVSAGYQELVYMKKEVLTP